MGLFDFFRSSPQATHHVFDVTDATFEMQALRRSFKTPLLVDFWAVWCTPCRQLGPVIERIAMEPDSPVMLAKLNTDENPVTSARFEIRSIPNVLLLRNGAVVGGFVGVQFEQTIRSYLDEKLALEPPPLPTAGRASLNSARKLLQRGKGFEAALTLQALPDQPEKAPLRQIADFIWDIEDGDGLSGIEPLDRAYRKCVQMLRENKPDEARTTLQAAQTYGEPVDQEYTRSINLALASL